MGVAGDGNYHHIVTLLRVAKTEAPQRGGKGV